MFTTLDDKRFAIPAESIIKIEERSDATCIVIYQSENETNIQIVNSSVMNVVNRVNKL